MKKLSDKQRRIISYINRFLSDKGYPPSIRDIQAGCGISSTSVVDYNLNILESQGHIRRHAEVSRGIELLTRSSNSDSLVLVPIIFVHWGFPDISNKLVKNYWNRISPL